VVDDSTHTYNSQTHSTAKRFAVEAAKRPTRHPSAPATANTTTTTHATHTYGNHPHNTSKFCHQHTNSTKITTTTNTVTTAAATTSSSTTAITAAAKAQAEKG
jgi:hypothetical protein